MVKYVQNNNLKAWKYINFHPYLKKIAQLYTQKYMFFQRNILSIGIIKMKQYCYNMIFLSDTDLVSPRFCHSSKGALPKGYTYFAKY